MEAIQQGRLIPATTSELISKLGRSGSEVAALQTALQNDGESVTSTGTFDDQTASAVTGFQEKYASDILAPNGLQHGTGYVGVSTRTKLNSLCSGGQQPTPTPPVRVCPAWGCNGPQPIPTPITTTISQITSPSAGTQWAIGTTQNITWTPPQGAAGAVITIQNNVSTAGCQTSLCLYNSGHESYLLTPNGFPLNPNNGSFAWKVGTAVDSNSGNTISIPIGTYQVNITFEDANGNQISGQTQLSSGWFTITSGTNTVTPTVTSVTLSWR